METIFTGIKPTGDITLGNYLGAVKNFNDTTNDEDTSYFCIVDLHALTITPTKKEFNHDTKSLVAFYIACGLHEKTNIFLQSHIKEHTELAWLLQCFAKTGELERMTQYKDKSQGQDSVGVGLFTYPVLMAADILLYDATVVPVGADQKQHIELTRDLAQKINSFYNNEIFTLPTPTISKTNAKIYSLTDPSKKMSKSDENPKSYISMLDDYKKISKKIKSATTDSVGVINYDQENQPGIVNLINIYASCKNEDPKDVANQFKDDNYGTLKQAVIDAIWAEIEPIQLKYHEILNNQDQMNEILNQGNKVAQQKAQQKINEVKKEFGFLI